MQSKSKLSKYEEYLLVTSLGSEFRKCFYKEKKLQRRIYLYKYKGTAYLKDLSDNKCIVFSPMFYNKYSEIFSSLDESKYSHGKNKQHELLHMAEIIVKKENFNLSYLNKLFEERALKSLYTQIDKNYSGFQTFLELIKQENISNKYTRILIEKYPFLRAYR